MTTHNNHVRVLTIQVATLVAPNNSPIKCGVADYYKNLMKALNSNSDFKRMNSSELEVEFNNFTKFLLTIKRSLLPPVVHIQYPMEAWGRSILPGVTPFILKLLGVKHVIITLHEWSHMHPLRKLSIVPGLFFCDSFIFVSKTEQSSFKKSLSKVWRHAASRTHLIPIGSNIEIPEISYLEILEERKKLATNDEILLGYFGFIYPAKQLDKVLLALRQLLDRSIKIKLVICGDFPNGHEDSKTAFFKLVAEHGLNDNVVFLGYIESETELARTLSACDLNVQLYDDGLTARRGSFWYALNLGLKIISTKPLNADEFSDMRSDFNPYIDSNVSLVEIEAKPESIGEAITKMIDVWKPPIKRDSAPKWTDAAHLHQRLYSSFSQ